jgi:fumarate reductase subunit D
VPLLSAVFAAINCVAWSYDNNDTLSSIEIGLWQLCSFAGVAFWLISVQSLLMLTIVDWLGWADVDSFSSNVLCAWMLSPCALFYVLLRISSFILAIRELNMDASLILDTAGWTYFIPHI